MKMSGNLPNIAEKNKLAKFAAESCIITLLSVIKSYRVGTFFTQNIVIAFLSRPGLTPTKAATG